MVIIIHLPEEKRSMWVGRGVRLPLSYIARLSRDNLQAIFIYL
jgi:hypothetical protein